MPSPPPRAISPAYASWDAAQALSAPWVQATQLGDLMTLREGETISSQGQPHAYFYLLRSGFVHTTRVRSNGAHLLVEIFGPGAIFGEAPAFADLPRAVTTRTVTQVVVSRYLPKDVETAMQRQPELAVSLLRLLGYKTHHLVRKLTRFASGDPQERVVELLARVSRLDMAADGGAVAASVELTHEQIAAMVGLSRVTVTRTLRLLAQRDLVTTAPGRVVIRSASGLMALLHDK